MFKQVFGWLILSFLVSACSSEPTVIAHFSSSFAEKRMIYNQEESNLVEGHYLKVMAMLSPTEVRINLPAHFSLENKSLTNWVLGWGNGKEYYDNGTQNVAVIKSLDVSTGIVVLGKQMKGNVKLQKGKYVVFWKRSPEKWKKEVRFALSSKWFKGFNGKSMSMGGIVPVAGKKGWIMFLSECDVQKKHWYAVRSNNLIDWVPVNGGNPILTFSVFSRECKAMDWNAMPYISSVLLEGDRLVMILDGENRWHHRTMGILTASIKWDKNQELLFQRVRIHSIHPKDRKRASFSGKIAIINKKYRVYFDLKTDGRMESVYYVDSKDLKSWSRPVLVSLGRTGWRSNISSSEPCWVEVQGKMVTLWAAGTKEYVINIRQRLGCQPHNIGTPGNVQDAQIGVFRSYDGGNTFFAHVNNPVLINDIIDPHEDDHMGGNMVLLSKDNRLFYFYQAKSLAGYYGVYLRIKRK